MSLLEKIKRVGAFSVVSENAELMVRSEGVSNIVAVLQAVATAKSLPMQVLHGVMSRCYSPVPSGRERMFVGGWVGGCVDLSLAAMGSSSERSEVLVTWAVVKAFGRW